MTFMPTYRAAGGLLGGSPVASTSHWKRRQYALRIPLTVRPLWQGRSGRASRLKLEKCQLECPSLSREEPGDIAGLGNDAAGPASHSGEEGQQVVGGQKQDKVSRLAALAEIERIKEMQRRKRISEANRGRQPWNKGRRHSPETIAKIRAGTVKAMARPEVRAKLEAYNETQRKPHDEATKEKIRRILKERSVATRATITAQCRVVLEKMAGSDDPQMREAARFEGALDVLGTVSWNFVKKDWDQLVARWEENPEFRERAVQRILSRMYRPGEPKKRPGNKMKVALDTFKKLKEARGRLEQAQTAVAKLQQVKAALAQDPERQSKALAAEQQAAEVLEKLQTQVDKLTLAMGPLAQYLSSDDGGEAAAAAAEAAAAAAAAAAGAQQPVQGAVQAQARQAQQAEQGAAQAQARQAQQGHSEGSGAAPPGQGGGGSSSTGELQGDNAVSAGRSSSELPALPAEAGTRGHGLQHQPQGEPSQQEQEQHQPVHVNGAHAAVNGTAAGKPLLGHAMPAAPAAISALLASPHQPLCEGEQRDEAEVQQQRAEQQQHAEQQQGYSKALHHGGQGAAAAEIACTVEKSKEAATAPSQAQSAELGSVTGPGCWGVVASRDDASSTRSGNGGSAAAQESLTEHGHWSARQPSPGQSGAGEPAAPAADTAVQPPAMQLPRLQPHLFPQLAATAAAAAGVVAPAVQLGAMVQQPAGRERERELVTVGSASGASTGMPANTPAVSLSRAQYWHFSRIASAATLEQQQQQHAELGSSLSVASPPAEAAASDELLSHEQVLKVAEQLNGVLRQHGSPTLGQSVLDSEVARSERQGDAEQLGNWLLCSSSTAAPAAAEGAGSAAVAAAIAAGAAPAESSGADAAAPRGRGRPRKGQALCAEAQQQQEAEQGVETVEASVAALRRGRGRPRREHGPDSAAAPAAAAAAAATETEVWPQQASAVVPEQHQRQLHEQQQCAALGSPLAAVPLPNRRPSRLHSPAHQEAWDRQHTTDLPGWTGHVSAAVVSSAASRVAPAAVHLAAPTVPAGTAAAEQEPTAGTGRAAAEQQEIAAAPVAAGGISTTSSSSDSAAVWPPAHATRKRGRPSKAEAAARQQEIDFAVALEAASVVAVLEGRASALHKSVMSGLKDGSLDWPRLLQERRQQQEAVQRRGVPVPLFPTAAAALGKLREELPKMEQTRKGVEGAVVVLLREVSTAREARLGESGPVGGFPRRPQAGPGVGRRRLPWQHQ